MKKKILPLLLAILTLVLGVFSLSSCKDKRKVDIDLLSFYENGTEVVYDDGQMTLRFYIDPDFGYDVTDFEKVKIKFKYDRSSETVTVKKDAHVPDGARGNPELQYFYVILDSMSIEEDRPVSVMSASGVFTDRLAEEDAEKQGRFTVFGTFMLGLGMLVIGFGMFYFGFSVRDDRRGLILMALGELLPIIVNVAIYTWWGPGRGIIISIFCALNIAAAILVMKLLD